MRYPTTKIPFLLAASAAIITAQETTAAAGALSTSGDTHCANPQLVDQCLTIMKSQLDKCHPDDWDCKCTGIANVANCYADCPDDPDHFAAELLSEQICATDMAYRRGISTVATTWTTPGINKAEATPTGDSSTTTGDGPSSTGGPTKSASPSEGAAAVNAVGNSLAILELLGLWIMV